MASSMLTGDRRWAPTRKSGMTFLGKVPKPINLPSQRLENHGLDPAVEIVPKGTLTWGSRPSSATPNAWGTSSMQSPNAEGSSDSPSFDSGRPSSGSGTRPSTTGSNRSHEPICSAWGSNSRPSSASGILASTQLSTTATRPRSAEARPGSSQLSRFADNPVDSTGAWGTAGTAGRLTASSKTSGFTLSSGDFPSLGTEKNLDSHSQRGDSSHGRPNSASGTESVQTEIMEPQLAGYTNAAPLDHRVVNTWNADNPPFAGHGGPPNMEDWHRDPCQPQPYPNRNMLPPPFDSWHNPPFYPADGAWYRGAPAGGPFRPPGPPGSYPIDYVPVRPFPRRDADPGGYYPNNYEPYRPHMPSDRYMGPSHPDMPMRPGPYSSPAPYDGYYAPPYPNFYNSSNTEAPIMGMARPVVHNQFPNQHANFGSRNFHARPAGYTPGMNKEQMKPDQVHDTQGQYRVLVKQHDGPDNLGVMPHEEDWGINSQPQDKAASPSLMHREAVSSQSQSHVDGQSTETVARNFVQDLRKAVDDGLLERPEAANIHHCGPQQYPVMKKNATLMEKVEGLNTRARMADSHGEGRLLSSKDKTNISNAAAEKESNALTEVKKQESTNGEKVLSGPSSFVVIGENAHSVGQKNIHGAKGVDSRRKLKSNWHDNDEWAKKTPGSESSVNSTMCNIGGAPESDPSEEGCDKLELRPAAILEDESLTSSSLDPDDYKAQRAKMKEVARLHAKRLQQEEEERVREQKAKALAKLEELNRRTLAVSSTQRLSNSPQSSDSLNTEHESKSNDTPKSESNETPKSDTNTIENSAGTSFDSTKKSGNSSESSSNVSLKMSTSTLQNLGTPAESVGQHDNDVKITPGTTTDIQDHSILKQNQVVNRRSQSVPPENIISQKQTDIESAGNPKDAGEVSVHVPVTLPSTEDPSIQNRKKNNRSAKYSKSNLDESMKNSTLPSPLGTEGSSERGKTRPLVVADVTSVPSEGLSGEEIPNIPLTQELSETGEGARTRGNNHEKFHTQRKSARNQQPNKPISKYHGTEVVTWAPVKPSSKNETPEIAQISVSEATNPSGNSGTKAKRAEMERYVPKPVAKELLQQVSSQQTSPSSGEIPSVESVKLDEQTIGKYVTAPDIKNLENIKHNKHGRPNAAWRQRNSVEAAVTSDQARSVPKAEPLNIDSSTKMPLTNPDDSWNNNNDHLSPSEILTSSVAAKSYGSSKQRRQPYKAQRVLSGNNPTSDNNMNSQQRISDKTERQSHNLSRNGSEVRNVVRNEGLSGGGEHVKSHWQPKSQAHSQSQGMNENNNEGNEHIQEPKRQSKVVASSSKEQTFVESAPNSNYQHDQAVSSGVNQCRQYNGRTKQNFHANADKRKNNSSQVEYQRTESFGKRKESFRQNPGGGEGVDEASWAPGPRYRERGRQYPRGVGHIHGQSTGPAARVGY